ncbi:MAG: Prolyl-tRNA editing protein [Firmicutes bacterium]|nr:Prolyl-tRNA editing protein [Bacillota bacterium]MDI6707129.1 YbaK/EbsC family protein [Bacillota bacterium]
MAVEDVRRYFIERGYEDPVFEMDESSATVELAAKAVGVEPGRIAKTLAFRLKDRDILIVTKGDARIDNKKFKQSFKTKAKMLSAEEVLEVTGHPVGGVCPFGLKNPLDVYLDISLKEYESVYPAAGSGNSALKITPEDMKSLTGGDWVDVCQE